MTTTRIIATTEVLEVGSWHGDRKVSSDNGFVKTEDFTVMREATKDDYVATLDAKWDREMVDKFLQHYGFLYFYEIETE